MFNTFVKQTEVNSGGGIRISVYKQSFGPDGNLIAEQPHQIMIGPFDDFDVAIAANNAALENMGYPAIDPAELSLPISLRATAHAHSGVKERMAIEAAAIEARRVADEEAAKLAAEQAEKDRIRREAEADAAQAEQQKLFDAAVDAAIERKMAKA